MGGLFVLLFKEWLLGWEDLVGEDVGNDCDSVQVTDRTSEMLIMGVFEVTLWYLALTCCAHCKSNIAASDR